MRSCNRGIIGENVRRLRGALGYSQFELAKRSDVLSVGQIESGAILMPRIETLKKLANALGVRLADLFVE